MVISCGASYLSFEMVAVELERSVWRVLYLVVHHICGAPYLSLQLFSINSWVI
jgi:hypothetical protein